jgi:hypothetical protein
LKVRADPLHAREKLARQIQAQVSNRREQRQSALPLALRETDLPVKGGGTRKNDKNTQSLTWNSAKKKSGKMERRGYCHSELASGLLMVY